MQPSNAIALTSASQPAKLSSNPPPGQDRAQALANTPQPVLVSGDRVLPSDWEEVFPAPARPGTMAFNDEQRAWWAAQGRRAGSVQISQAAQLQNPFGVIGDSIKGLANWLIGAPSQGKFSRLEQQFSQTIGTVKFTARKTAALKRLEAEGIEPSRLAVTLRDSDHSSPTIKSAITAFLSQHLRGESGHIFLVEAGLFITDGENGKLEYLVPDLAKHHAFFCHKVPPRFCRFLNEPKETEAVRAAMAGRRDLLDRIFDFLMNAIPQKKADAARAELANFRNQSFASETEFKTKLLIRYQKFCDPAKQERLSRRVDPLAAAVENERKAEAAASKARDSQYLDDIKGTLNELAPGAFLFTLTGAGHGRRLESRLDEIPGYHVEIQDLEPKKEL